MKFDLFILLIVAAIPTIGGNQSPQWNNFPSTLMVNEDAPVGLTVALLNATDPEDDNLRFSVRGGLGGEVLRLMTLNTSEVLVVLARPLDREAVDEYNLLFTVADNHNLVQRWCTLYVLDVNDNHPRFLDAPYYTSIPETTPVGTEVYRVSASDPDTGVWSLISFALKTKSDHFRVNTAHGAVILTKKLDYSTHRSFQLEIMAIDGGGLSSKEVLEIRVTQSERQQGEKTLRCFSCIQNVDCDHQQLSYSPTVTCQANQVCFVSAKEDPWKDFRYRRGCRDMTQCTNGKEECEKNKYGRYECRQCCHTSACNAALFKRHMLQDATTLLQSSAAAGHDALAGRKMVQIAAVSLMSALLLTVLLTNNI